MKYKLGAILYYILLYPISKLPYFLLYSVSTFLYVMLYYVLGYRKKVISENIALSFPEKGDKEIQRIVQGFYRHFADLLVEIFQNFTISRSQIKKLVKFENPELLDALYEKGKSVVIATSHYGNWEMLAVAIGDLAKHQHHAIYKPLNSEFYDKKMKEAREKLGLTMFPMAETFKYFKKKHESPIAIFFASDQWPSNPKRAYWTKFLGRETPVLMGVEQYAKLFDWPVVYCEMNKVKRGYYSVKFELITETPQKLENGEIMNLYGEKLETTIRTKPEYWLWSHRRWKRTKEEVFGL